MAQYLLACPPPLYPAKHCSAVPAYCSLLYSLTCWLALRPPAPPLHPTKNAIAQRAHFAPTARLVNYRFIAVNCRSTYLANCCHFGAEKLPLHENTNMRIIVKNKTDMRTRETTPYTYFIPTFALILTLKIITF
jgi:hypothetical protein